MNFQESIAILWWIFVMCLYFPFCTMNIHGCQFLSGLLSWEIIFNILIQNMHNNSIYIIHSLVLEYYYLLVHKPEGHISFLRQTRLFSLLGSLEQWNNFIFTCPENEVQQMTCLRGRTNCQKTCDMYNIESNQGEQTNSMPIFFLNVQDIKCKMFDLWMKESWTTCIDDINN